VPLTQEQMHEGATPAPLSRLAAQAIDRLASLARRRITIYMVAVCVAIYGLVQRWSGLGRSLWLDEAWVANSVVAPTLKGMFYYDAWLQTSPPLFLLLVRAVVSHFGISNSMFRVIPLCMGIFAVLIMLFFVIRTFLRQYALLAWTLLALSPVAIDYSRELKQYSSELAVSTAILLGCSLYIQSATARRFWLLVGTVISGLLVGYGTLLTLPGLLLFLLMNPIRSSPSSTLAGAPATRFTRACLLAAAAAGTLIGEYFFFIRPNSPSVLSANWTVKSAVPVNIYRLLVELPLNHLLRKQGMILSIIAVIVIPGVIVGWSRFRKGRRKWFELQVLSLSSCLLLIVSDKLSRYPFSERTGLLLLPFVIVLIVSSLQLMHLVVLQRRRAWARPFLDIALLCVVAMTIKASYRGNREVMPREDADGAVSFLRANVRPGDFLWVHASCAEAFKLYSRIDKWHGAPVHYGHTGWPCCARGIDKASSTFGEGLVHRDFGSALPRSFDRRVWLLYTMRPQHWLRKPDERAFMQRILRERGCIESPTPFFYEIRVSSFDCK
jgi:hypothetical protein